MKMCDNCGIRAASVHIRKKLNNMLEESYLCSECAAKYSNALLSFVSIDKFISNMINSISEKDHEPENSIKCAACGYTLDKLKKTGRVGCAECYNSFAEQLAPVLGMLYQGRKHTVSMDSEPVSAVSAENNTDQIVMLRKRLEEAISKEEYELAAKIRDEIKEYKNGEAE